MTEHQGAIAWIRLNRPAKLNAFGWSELQAFGDAVMAAARDSASRVVIVIGNGRAFSAGADLALLETPDYGSQIGDALRTQWLPILSCLRTMPKPVICGLNGVAAGIGASVALACDIRIAADTRISASP